MGEEKKSTGSEAPGREHPAEETGRPAQGARTGTSGEDGTGKQLGPPDWSIRGAVGRNPGLDHPGTKRENNPGVERPGIHEKEEAARTSSKGTQDQEHGSGPRRGERRRRPRQERPEVKGTNDRPRRRHPAVQEAGKTEQQGRADKREVIRGDQERKRGQGQQQWGRR